MGGQSIRPPFFVLSLKLFTIVPLLWMATRHNQVKGQDGADAPDTAVTFVDADLSSEDSVKSALARAAKTFGPLNGLVNVSPSPFTKPFPLDMINLDRYTSTLGTELTTPLLCAKQASAAMKAGGGGSVVFVVEAGDRGLAGGAGNLPAVTAMTASAAAAGGPDGIRVNCVSHGLGGNGGSGGHGTFPLATMRAPSAEDVAMQVAHLLSDKTAFLTGQTIAADSVRCST